MKYLFVVLFAFTALISCTTGDDSSDGLEDELESEMEDMAEGSEADDASVAADEDDTEAGDADSEETAESDDASEDEDLDSEEDEEFLAEDSTSPTVAPVDKLEEKDLQNELEKENTAANGKDPVGVVPAEPLMPTDPNAPNTQAVNATPGNETVAAAPAAGAVSASTADTSIPEDGFEVVNPPPLPQEDLGVPAPLVADVDPPLPSEKMAQELVPLAKIEQKTFQRNGRIMNTVYFVRPNEDLGAISQKLFNEDKTAVLVADNDFVLKGLETGDRIYYNSPHRPQDDKLMLTYYEDNKMPPQYYVTRKGDDLKKIGREILGTEEGWREIWSTNEVLQTQALLPAGLKIRYWSGSEPRMSPETTGPTLATTNGDAGMPPPSGPEPVAETLPDLPPTLEPSTLSSEDPGLAVTTAPPPMASGPSLPPVEAPSMSAQGESSLMTVAAIALIAMAGIAIVAIQIKNRKKDSGSLPPSLEFTKV